MNRHPLTETFDQMLRQELPNLFRLYINPYVVQACFCLERYVQTTWDGAGSKAKHQTFLANAFDEALGGAIKLARYDRNLAGKPALGLIVDAAGRLGPFASAKGASGATVEFLPGLVVVGREWPPAGSALWTDPPENGAMARSAGPAKSTSQDLTRFGFIALIPDADGGLGGVGEDLRRLLPTGGLSSPLIITALSRSSLAALRRAGTGVARELAPDIVVFDDSFTDRHVPFGAFTARQSLFEHWNRPGKTTFHSTTYQPNTISTLHFVRVLNRRTPLSTPPYAATCGASNGTRTSAANCFAVSTAGPSTTRRAPRVSTSTMSAPPALRMRRPQGLRRRQRRRVQRPGA